jgi:hypothetical protein
MEFQEEEREELSILELEVKPPRRTRLISPIERKELKETEEVEPGIIEKEIAKEKMEEPNLKETISSSQKETCIKTTW